MTDDRPPANPDEPLVDEQSPAPPEPALHDPIDPSDEMKTVIEKGWSPPKRNRRTNLVFALLIVAGAALALFAWGLPPFRSSAQSTDNAYVRGQITVISPQVGGYVTEVLVKDFERVTAGQALVRIDDRVFRQRISQAKANIATQAATLANSSQSARSSGAQVTLQDAAIDAARAALAKAQADMRRVSELVAEGSVSLRERDQTLASLRQARAGVEQAQAQRTIAQQQVQTVEVGRGGLAAGVDNAKAAMELAQIDLANTIVRAPRAGQVGEVGVKLGQLVAAGTQLMFLVPEQLWIVANFKENQIAGVATGYPASLRIDALGGATLAGTVERISPATGSEFSIVRPDTANGNFVKVAQRIPVRIRINPGQTAARRLMPGMSVEVSVDSAKR